MEPVCVTAAAGSVAAKTRWSFCTPCSSIVTGVSSPQLTRQCTVARSVWELDATSAGTNASTRRLPPLFTVRVLVMKHLSDTASSSPSGCEQSERAEGDAEGVRTTV